MKTSHKKLIIFLYVFLILICVAGSILCNTNDKNITLVAVLSFSSIIAAALIISWGAETAQFMISQGLAVAIIAVLQVLPEFFVEAVIAWSKNVHLMLANFTGSNRLLMGLGWPSIFFIYYYTHYFKYKHKPESKIKLREEHVLEIMALLLGCIYFIKILFLSKITVFDSVVFLLIFVYYFWALSKLPPEKEERICDLIAPPRYLAEIRNKAKRSLYVTVLFVISGATLVFVAHPFLESMKTIAAFMGISTFLFVQWVAPFLTEFPEKLTSFYWAARERLAPMGLLNMVSSSVNQWTLLIAMVPLVYSLSCGRLMFIPLDDTLRHEVLLTVAMTFYGVVCLSKFELTRANAFVIFSFWLVQFIIPQARVYTTVAFMLFTVLEIIIYHKKIGVIPALKKTFKRICAK